MSKFRPPNFIGRSLLVILLTREKRVAEFSQISYLSILFALRAPSEAITLSRSYN